MSGLQFRDIRFTVADGLSLHARDYQGETGRMPALCLSGLTRNLRDFEPLIARIGGSRRIIAMDYRGRGRSDYAPDPTTYRIDVETGDALALLDHLGVAQAAVIGTSRGGLIAMAMAARALDRLAGVLFNDIGPVIERAGLLRIRSYLGKTVCFTSWDDAVGALKRTHVGFDLSDEEWLGYARRIYREEKGLPHIDYDLRLGETFPSAEELETSAAPDLWPLFDLLKGIPCAVLRGELSDLLGEATVAEMTRHHPDLIARTVTGRGHVPFLDEPESLAAIQEWLARVDRRRHSYFGAPSPSFTPPLP
jgi:pimeloyl-ACP methyl ester carboxylesterase